MVVRYYSTNDHSLHKSFKYAFLKGMPNDYGLFMVARKEVPKLTEKQIRRMTRQDYAGIAHTVLSPFVREDIPSSDLGTILTDAYDPQKIPTRIQKISGNANIMWLTQGPTYSFKDYAARFFGRVLNYFLEQENQKRVVLVATSGDTGGAVADALHGLSRVSNVVFYPKGEISEGQRRQMTTLGGNVYAFEVNGDFDVCQALAKQLLGDKDFAWDVFYEKEMFTSANSISVGRLLPQAVYPFFAYSRLADYDEPLLVSIPSGNFGDMMGTVLAKEMGLPISNIAVALNPNKPFKEFLETGEYQVGPSIETPSSAMRVSHPSNLARLIDFYGGHMFDKRCPVRMKVIKEGVIDKMPDLNVMRQDLFVTSVNNEDHFITMKKVWDQYGILLDPHGAVGFKALEEFLHDVNTSGLLSVMYETADPGKFPIDVKKATGITPELPEGMKKQAKLDERVYSITEEPEKVEINGKTALKLSKAQIDQAKSLIFEIFH